MDKQAKERFSNNPDQEQSDRPLSPRHFLEWVVGKTGITPPEELSEVVPASASAYPERPVRPQYGGPEPDGDHLPPDYFVTSDIEDAPLPLPPAEEARYMGKVLVGSGV